MRRVNVAFWLLGLCVFGVFAYINWRYVDVQFLEYTMGDEFPQFLQLQKMYEALLEHDIKNFFAFEFYNYGFLWYVANLIVVLPFKIFPNYELAIYAPRMLNAFFAIALLAMIYKIARLYLSPKLSLLFCVFAVAMPGFWKVGYTFKPDTFQALLLLCCVYYLCRDNFAFGRFYRYGIVLFGLALGAAKFQAVMFLPLVYGYIFYLFATSPDVRTLLQVVKKSALATLAIFVLWIVTNPYLLHPRGFLAWLSMFRGNMNSNATNHGSYIDVGIAQKIFEVVDFYYFALVVFCVLVLVCAMLSFRALQILLGRARQDWQRYDVFIPIALSFAISMLYLFVQVNKAWEVYYFSSICFGILLFIPFVLALNAAFTESRARSKGALAKIALGGGAFSMLIALEIFGGIYNHAYARVLEKYPRDLQAIYEQSDKLATLLAPYFEAMEPPFTLLIDTPLAYLRFGLEPKHIYRPYGRLNPEGFVYEEWSKKPHTFPFVPKDFIILRKDSAFFSESKRPHIISQDLEQSLHTLKELQAGTLPYEKILDTEDFVVFKNLNTSHKGAEYGQK